MAIINGSDIRNWDPALTSGTFPGGPMDVLDAIYGFLVYVDVRGQVTGGMAESLTSADATTWTLKLREGVTFTDGTPFDAEAVKFNWERAADPATLAPTRTFMASWVQGIRVVDARTLTITLPEPNSHFAAQIAELAPFIASPTMLRAAREKTDIRPVGAGPFTLLSWNQGISMTMARNPGYWDQPRPYLDTLTFRIIPETNARIATVVQGGATMMAGYLRQFGSNARARGVGTVDIPIRGIYRAYFNHQRGVFTDQRAREALYAAIDRARLMQAFTQAGGYQPPSNFFGSQSPFYDASIALPAHDRARAQALFDAVRAGGRPLEVRIVHATNSDLKRLGAYVQQVLGSFTGVTPVLVEVDQATLPQRCRTQMEFDICFEGGVLVANRPEPVISSLLSTGGLFNWGQYSSPAMDTALARSRGTVDPAAVRAAYADVQRLMATELPFYLFGEESRSLLVRDTTGGVVPSNGGILQKQFLFVCPSACVR